MVTEKPDKKGLDSALNILRTGGLIICPSDTVYGLLVDAKNEKAVEKLVAFKNRPKGKPISVFLPNISSIDEYVHADKKQKQTLTQLLPGPFTVILPSKHAISKKLESERGTLGIRFPDYAFINMLVGTYGSPVTATSANLSGRAPHYMLESLFRELSHAKASLIDLVIDGGKLPKNKPSTVVDLTGSTLKIMRHGDVAANAAGVYRTKSPLETSKTAAFITNKYLSEKNECIVFILEGEMGVGKTIFVKGASSLFGVHDIVSPTYVVSYEYDVKSANINKLVHADLFNIEDAEEFRHLGFEAYIQPGTIMFIEWGEKAGELYEILKKNAKVIHISMKYINSEEREIRVKEGEIE